MNQSEPEQKDGESDRRYLPHDPAARLKEAYRVMKERPRANAQPEQPPASVVKLPVQFAFLWPDEVRCGPNDLLRSGLFTAIQGKDRQLIKDAKVAAVGSIELYFTGEQLNQDDLDVWAQLVHMARHHHFGQTAIVPANAILKALGRATGKTQHQQLAGSIKRLTAAMIELRNTKKRASYYGHLIDDAIKNDVNRHWTYTLNPKLKPLFDRNFTLYDWQTRLKLKGKDLARFVHEYLATHAAPYPLKVETWRELSHSRAQELWKFRQMLRTALTDLENVAFLSTWEIDAADLVHTTRKPTPSQIRHLVKKATKP